MNGLERCRNAALALVLCTACSGSVGTQYAKTGVIGPSGGTLTITGSDDSAIAGTSITIPAGALSVATTIKIGKTNQAVVSSGALGPVIDFEQSVRGTVFAKAATVTIPVNLPGGFNPSRVGVMALEATGTSYDITAVTVANGLVTFQVSGFTDYGAHDEGDHDGDKDGGCTATCGGDAVCGASDGCGGTCDANCADAGCTPRCGDDAACGASNGCGGTCEHNCKDAGCTPSCGGDAACGSSDGCGGTCDANCTDGGTGCGGIDCGQDFPDCCGASCVNLATDSSNCGACGNACEAPTGACVHGVCACADSETLCGQPDAGIPLFCINTSKDAENCGSCGNVCDDTYATNSGCSSGACSCGESAFLCGAAGSAGAACISNDDRSACDGGNR